MTEEQKQIKSAILSILDILQNNFKYSYGKKISFDEVFEMMNDLYVLFNNFEQNTQECGELVVKRYIPLLDLLIAIDKNYNHLVEYEKHLKNAYKLGARVSLEHYMVYREWNEPEKEKFFEPRYNILVGYMHYLQELECNPNFTTLIFNAPSGYGKEIADFEPVLTKNGWNKHGDLKVGDYVLSPTGKFVKVIEIHPKIISDKKVTFEDGETIVCHSNHEWIVYDRKTKKMEIRETKYMMEHLKEKDGRNRFLVPMTSPLAGEYKNLPVDPYTYGIWLGDGTTCQGCITENVEDMKIMINHLAYESSSSNAGVSDNVRRWNFPKLLVDLHKLGLGYKGTPKFIHESYLTASIEQRLELLAGLIDSDGYLDKVRQRYIISTANPKLRDDIKALVSTFGWRTSVTAVQPSTSTSGIVGKREIYYIGFSPSFEVPCKLPRKQLTRLHKQRRIGINKIEHDDNEFQGNCISVEGGVYLVGKTLKPTHNSYPKKISEAWSFGINNTGAILALCSNDDVVKSGSRTVIDEIKSEQFGEVFPNMKWNENDKDFFLKETDEKWKLKTCKLPYSYYAKTTQANVVGSRASKSIHIDDLYPDYKEAMNQALNKYYYTKSITVWEKRFVQNKKPKVCITGTLWASGDYIDLKIQQLKKEHKFFKHPKYPYTYISEDKSCAIIQVPALDYETGESTCPELKSTSELLKEKANMEEYIWETNFQQKPTNPESLIFSYDKLRTYSTVPESDYKGTYAVIDATRKTGKDFFAMPIFRKVANDNLFDYYLIDALFTRTATKDMYNDIVDKIIENNIVFMVIESNVTSELKSNVERICRERGIVPPEIIEKYNVENKSARITNEMHLIKKVLIFPDKTMYGVNTDIGKFMGNLTTYNSDGQNANDDAPDSAALFCSEIIEENSQSQLAEPLPFIREFL